MKDSPRCGLVFLRCLILPARLLVKYILVLRCVAITVSAYVALRLWLRQVTEMAVWVIGYSSVGMCLDPED